MNAALFALAILLTLHYLASPRSACKYAVPKEIQCPLVILGFLSPVFAVLIGQALRGDLRWPDYDAPSRLILGATVFYTIIRSRALSTSTLIIFLTVGLTIALALLPLGVTTEATQRWDGRFSTKISDPNTFGSYVGLMLMLVASIVIFLRPSETVQHKTVGFAANMAATSCSITVAVWALVGSHSRGAWIAVAGSFVGMIILLVSDVKKRVIDQGAATRMGFVALGVLASFVITVLVAPESINHAMSRFHSIEAEFQALTKGAYAPNSMGIRVQMFSASLSLFKDAPLTGYGDLNYRDALASGAITTQYPAEVLQMLAGAGPHSEVFGRALQSGVWGLVSSVLFIGIPFFVFWCNRRTDRSRVGQAANNAGLIMMIYFFLIQITIEFTLKHTASFNAFILAILLAISVKSARLQDPNAS